MTLDEAIQELGWELVRDKMALSQRTVSAIKLGIEALKVVSDNRVGKFHSDFKLLPGETEE